MQILAPALVYLLVLIFFVVRMLRSLFNTQNGFVRGITITILVIFFVILMSEIIPFIQNENGKSFTVGWFALAYFLILTFTPFTFCCWILFIINKRL